MYLLNLEDKVSLIAGDEGDRDTDGARRHKEESQRQQGPEGSGRGEEGATGGEQMDCNCTQSISRAQSL